MQCQPHATFCTLELLRCTNILPLPLEILDTIYNIYSYDTFGYQLIPNLSYHIISNNVTLRWLYEINYTKALDILMIAPHSITNLINLLQHPNYSIKYKASVIIDIGFINYRFKEYILASNLLNIISDNLSSIMAQMHDISIFIIARWIKFTTYILSHTKNVTQLLKSGVLSSIKVHYNTFASTKSQFTQCYICAVGDFLHSICIQYWCNIDIDEPLLDIIDNLLTHDTIQPYIKNEIIQYVTQTTVRYSHIEYVMKCISPYICYQGLQYIIQNIIKLDYIDALIDFGISNLTFYSMNYTTYTLMLHALINYDISYIVNWEILNTLVDKCYENPELIDFILKIATLGSTIHIENLCHTWVVKCVVRHILLAPRLDHAEQVRNQHNNWAIQYFIDQDAKKRAHNALKCLINMIQCKSNSLELRYWIVVYGKKILKTLRWYNDNVADMAIVIIKWIKHC